MKIKKPQPLGGKNNTRLVRKGEKGHLPQQWKKTTKMPDKVKEDVLKKTPLQYFDWESKKRERMCYLFQKHKHKRIKKK